MNRKRKILRFSDQLLIQILHEGIHSPYEVIKDAVPADVKIIDVRLDHFVGHIDFLLESDEFEATEQGTQYPFLETELRSILWGKVDK